MPRRSRVTEPVAGQLRGADDWYMSGVYVALGDSMSIDDYAGGAGRGAASLLYRNCDADFPERSSASAESAGRVWVVLPARLP